MNKGLDGLRDAAEHRLRKYVGPPRSGDLSGRYANPKKGNAIYYAQHATATCCRKCIEAWHGIDRERPLTDEEIGYMTGLVMHYVGKKLPELSP